MSTLPRPPFNVPLTVETPTGKRLTPQWEEFIRVLFEEALLAGDLENIIVSQLYSNIPDMGLPEKIEELKALIYAAPLPDQTIAKLVEGLEALLYTMPLPDAGLRAKVDALESLLSTMTLPDADLRTRIEALEAQINIASAGNGDLRGKHDDLKAMVASGVFEVQAITPELIFRPESYTMAAGAIALVGHAPKRIITVDTSGGASEDLNTVEGGLAYEELIIQAANDARTVVCKDGASLILQADFSLNNTQDKLHLVCIEGGVWHELGRASNGA